MKAQQLLRLGVKCNCNISVTAAFCGWLSGSSLGSLVPLKVIRNWNRNTHTTKK